MNSQFSIHSNRTVTPRGIREATVFISNGKIVEVVDGKTNQATDLIDLGDSVLMPGLIDSHVHINEPGRTHWEGFETATKAAAAGGITTLVDMPLNSTPVTTSVKSFQEKLESARGKLFVNCGFWGGIVPRNSRDLQPMIDAGVLGFKAFLTHSGIEDFPNASMYDLEQAAQILSKANLPLLVHAELDSPIIASEELKKYPTSYQAYLNSRPRNWEDTAVSALIELSANHNLRIHVVHLSSSDSLKQLKEARDKGLQITVETCPHYLFFAAETIPDADTQYKCAPPIREKANNNLLLEGLRNGVIDFVVTDHSPAPPALKKIESGNLKDAWGGISSLQFSLPVMWTIFRKNNFSINDLSRLMSENISKFLSLNHSKGRIEKGFDADLVAWNPENKFTVTEEMIQHRHKITPYLGSELYGVVEQTIVGGKKVYENGSFVSSPRGKIILSNL